MGHGARKKLPRCNLPYTYKLFSVALVFSTFLLPGMRFSTLLTSASSLLLATLALAEGPSDVIDLTPANFNSVVSSEKLILVEFFAPWLVPFLSLLVFIQHLSQRCGHCKALVPHYEEAATVLKEKGIKIAKVNCVDEPDLCQAHGVQGYPQVFFLYNALKPFADAGVLSTLKIFHDGEPTDYTGPRKADGIIGYMTK
jgi:protein disulfide-isomerase A1